MMDLVWIAADTVEIVYLSLSLFLAITISCPARASSLASSQFVWTHFANASGS